MSWTKRRIIERAFSLIGMASYPLDLEPEEWQQALDALDTMIASWQGYNVQLGYPLPASPEESSLDDESNLPDWAVSAAYLNLGVRLAGAFGKQVSPSVTTDARAAWRVVMARAAVPVKAKMDRRQVPSGAGNRAWRWHGDPFLPAPKEEILAGPNGSWEL